MQSDSMQTTVSLRPRDIGILATGFFHVGLMSGVILTVIMGWHL